MTGYNKKISHQHLTSNIACNLIHLWNKNISSPLSKIMSLQWKMTNPCTSVSLSLLFSHSKFSQSILTSRRLFHSYIRGEIIIDSFREFYTVGRISVQHSNITIPSTTMSTMSNVSYVTHAQSNYIFMSICLWYLYRFTM